MSMNLEDTVKFLYEIRDEREYQFRCVTVAAEKNQELAEYREKLKNQIDAIGVAIPFLRAERDKASGKTKQ